MRGDTGQLDPVDMMVALDHMVESVLPIFALRDRLFHAIVSNGVLCTNDLRA